LSKFLDKTSAGWRAALGEAGEFADAGEDSEPVLKKQEEMIGASENIGEVGEQQPTEVDPVSADVAVPDVAESAEVTKCSRQEFERRRGWRVDEATLERFRGLIAKFQGTQ
jgi:hypothetical protein